MNNFTLSNQFETFRARSDSTSTDKTVDSIELEGEQYMLAVKSNNEPDIQTSIEQAILKCAVNQPAIGELAKVRSRIKVTLDPVEKQILTHRLQNFKRNTSHLLYLGRQLKAVLSPYRYASQSASVETDGSQNPDSDKLNALQVACPCLTNKDITLLLRDEHASLLREMQTGVVDFFMTESTALAAKSKFQHHRLATIKRILTLVSDSKGMDSDETESLEPNDSPPKKSDFKKDESELRRLKTLIKQITSWEQLEWKIPLPGFTKDDYQTEVNRRHQLAAGVSKRHNRLDKWIVELNQYYAKYSDDGTQTQGLMTMSTKTSRKATGYKP